jgi:ferredoxin--NADP+ reductase
MGAWDAIVVGGEVGGLSAAAHLAVCGQRVLLLEQYNVVGGSGHVFRRPGGWQFEVGIHYLPGCAPGGLIPSMLDCLGLEGHVDFVAHDLAGFDTIVHPGGRLPVPVGWDNYLANLIAAFPAEEKALRRYVDVLTDIAAQLDRRAQTSDRRAVAALVGMGSGRRCALRPLAALLDACQFSAELRTVLSAQWLSYACPPSRAPVLLHVGFLEIYIGRGSYYPKGGGQTIAAALVASIEGHGGEVCTSAGVGRILVEGGRVAGVRTVEGERIDAPVVVSAADLQRTYADLVGHAHMPKRVARRMAALRMAPPWFNTYLGLDVDLHDWMPATNFYSVPSWRRPEVISHELMEPGYEGSRDEWVEQARAYLPAFMHSASRLDGDSPCHAPPGHSVLEVMTNVPPDPALWGTWAAPGRGDYRRGERYRELKAVLQDVMLDRAEEALPGIGRHVVFQEASTPYTTPATPARPTATLTAPS